MEKYITAFFVKIISENCQRKMQPGQRKLNSSQESNNQVCVIKRKCHNWITKCNFWYYLLSLTSFPCVCYMFYVYGYLLSKLQFCSTKKTNDDALLCVSCFRVQEANTERFDFDKQTICVRQNSGRWIPRCHLICLCCGCQYCNSDTNCVSW